MVDNQSINQSIIVYDAHQGGGVVRLMEFLKFLFVYLFLPSIAYDT